MSNRRIFLSLAVVGFAGVIAWAASAVWWPHASQSASPGEGVADNASQTNASNGATTNEKSAPDTSQPQAAAEPLPTGPIGQTWPELVRRAESGDGAAVIAIASTLSLCVNFVEDERKVVEDGLVDLLARVDETPNPAGKFNQDRYVDMAMETLDRRAAECAGIDSIGIENRMAERDRWMARALELGHPVALVEEADKMIMKYPTRADIVANAEKLRELRPQAMAMLARATAQGEPVALLRTAVAHRQGDLAERDPTAAYAHMLAYRAGPPTTPLQRTLIDGLEEELVNGLAPEQIEAARALSRQIRRRCCGDGE